MLNSDERKLKLLLVTLEQSIKPLINERSVYDADFLSAEVFEDLSPELQERIRELAFFDAITEIDRRAANQYWFLRLLAVTLILTRTKPVEKDDVLAAVIRERKIYCATGDPELLDKVISGKWAELTPLEVAQAITDGLLLQGVSSLSNGAAPSVNHVYSLA